MMSETQDTRREYAMPHMKVYGSIEQLTQKTLSSPNDGNFLDPGHFELNGSVVCPECPDNT